MGWTVDYINISKIFKEEKGLDGRVVSAANWQAWGPEFDSNRLQTIRFEIGFNFKFNYIFFNLKN